MHLLEMAANIATGERGWGAGTLRFQEIEQTRGQCPEAQHSLSGHHLIMVAAEQILLILEKGLHLPTDRQDVHESLCLQIHDGAAPKATGLVRRIEIMAGDEQKRRP